MTRIKNFILGLLIVIIVGFLLFMYIDYQPIKEYQDYFYQFNWFQPLLIGLAGLLILIGLILFLRAFKPTYRKPGLYKDYSDGHIYISRKSIENTVYDTLSKYDEVRKPNVVSKLYNKKKSSFIDITTDFIVPSESANVPSLVEQVRLDIKESVERFSELHVKSVKVNVRDQKRDNGPRVV
ncbi:alkaline shock response membrane anchor protein AmaP [Staphylococcus pseudintermedius]|nr:alkaline shock response membrane anchor protein AmaP [Staphylococcus pseudintermedius]